MTKLPKFAIIPILSGSTVLTKQQQIATGIVYTLLFALGHCLPVVIAGSSTAAVRKLMENKSWQGTGIWFRRGSGIVIVLLGVYLIRNP